MIAFITRLFAPGEPHLSEAVLSDARDLAELHAACFRRGWSDEEFARLLLEATVVTHRAIIAKSIAGFILSRRAADEAEILSIAVTASRRRRGLARRILDLHLRRLAGLGVRAVLLEVDEENTPARRLYARAGFQEVGRREGYYSRPQAHPSRALVLRRDLA
jgi:[ribosomal protein S18]-alanine N-acetyltransferase